MPQRKKGKRKSEPKWKIVKRAYKQIGFGENLSEDALDFQCKQVASTIPREHKTEQSIANYAIHIWYWNQEGCDQNSAGMDLKHAHKRLKGSLPGNSDEELEDKEVPLEEEELEDKEVPLEEEDLDLFDEEEESLPPKRAPRRSKRKRKRSPSPPTPDLSDPEDPLPPKSKKRRRLRSKIQSLGGDEEDSGPPDPFADEEEPGEARDKPDPPNASLAINGLDDDMFPELDDNEDEEKQPEEANSKPLENSAPPTPKKRNEQAPSSPKHKEDDGFLDSLFDTQEVEESQELLPPASASIGDTIPEETGENEGENAAEDEAQSGADGGANVNTEEPNWEEKKVLLRYMDIQIKQEDGGLEKKWEEVVVKETSIKEATTIRRLKKKVIKHAKLRIHGYDLFLRTPDGRVKMSDDGSTFSELDTISDIRKTYNINHIEISIHYSIMINFKLYADTLPQERKNENVFFHRKLCFKETCSLDRIISMFDDYDVEDVWINGEPVDIEESRLFSKDEVPEIILADGTLDVPGLKEYV